MVFSNESWFLVIHGAGKVVRHPCGSNHFDPKYMVKTVKHTAYTMIQGCFSGHGDRRGLAFLPRNMTMNGERYCEVLENHLLPFKEALAMQEFMHDGAPGHGGKKAMKFLQDNGTE